MEGRVENKILIVANDQEMRDRLFRSLDDTGFQLLAASDGRSALYQLGLFMPNLIVLDTALPNMDGWETLHRIREVSDVPVIVLTAVEEEAHIEGLHHGADYSMSRLFGLRELNARVHALLRRSSRSSVHSRQPHSTWI
jgi:DNA-binding response OmpR family regulator